MLVKHGASALKGEMLVSVSGNSDQCKEFYGEFNVELQFLLTAKSRAVYENSSEERGKLNSNSGLKPFQIQLQSVSLLV